MSRLAANPGSGPGATILPSGDLDLADFDDEDAQAAGRIRAALEKIGRSER